MSAIADLKNYRAPRSGPWPMIWATSLTAAFLGIVGPMDMAAAIDVDTAAKNLRVERLLLETSSRPADFDECQRTYRGRPRPRLVVSFQNGTGTPWHHRTCYFEVRS